MITDCCQEVLELSFVAAHTAHSGCIHNQKSDRSRFVGRDRSSPMKKSHDEVAKLDFFRRL